MKVAIVHDWTVGYAGSERVLEQMLRVLPDADLYAVADFVPERERAFLGGRAVRTTFIQRLPFARTKYRSYLPLMPLAVEQLDMSAYDLVVSSSHAVAKGVLTGPDQLHVCMCYSPIRYAWDLQHEYLAESGLTSGAKSWAARFILHRLRQWDVRTANGVDEFIGISEFIARRIWKTYRRPAAVIYPPVDTDAFAPRERKEDFYFTASRMVPYKRMDLIVEAFSAMPSRRLVVIGDGPDFAKVRAKAGPNVTLMGWQRFDVLRDHLQRARAFVFAAVEDFGIAPVEAQACGTPVIAYGRGAVLETIRADGDRPTGVLFGERTVPAIVEAVEAFERRAAEFDPHAARENALRFRPERFRQEFAALVAGAVRSHAERTGRPLEGPAVPAAGSAPAASSALHLER
ncbi:MAG TPA: glycosyltransferase family 4 protein [Gemmatimonadaceae bacterium]|nr:glycosyltransferase family 4 protein [Gemmatimonadaceae bacterium]